MFFLIFFFNEKVLPFISVVIPTYNRSALLAKGIASLQVQDYNKCRYEIVVVDNASTDHTKQVVDQFMSSNLPIIRYIYEPKAGSNYARNTGASCTKGDILAFIDDDARANSSWLKQISLAFIKHKNTVAVSGRIELELEIPKPSWIPEKYESYLGCNHFLGLESRELLPSEPVFEGNLAIRRDTFDQVNGFDINYGMVRDKIGANDGKNLVDQLYNFGNVQYQPEAIIYHYVPAIKNTPVYFLERILPGGC